MTPARMLVVVFVVVVIGSGFVLGRVLLSDSGPFSSGMLGQVSTATGPVSPEDSSKQTFTITAGETASQIGDSLQKSGLVRSALAFRLVVDQDGVGNSLAAGNYELSPSMSTEEIVQVLAHGEVKRGLTVTIPEGWRSEQIADRLQTTDFAPRDQFLAAVSNPPSVPSIRLLGDPPPASLEGYLFPSTYEVQEKVDGSSAADLMLQMFDKRMINELISGAAGRKLSPHQYLTLASIVEREAQKPEERATIASVYLNRLDRDMPLQADPTVQYAVATRDGAAASAYNYWKRDLTRDDLQIDSPYNTYVHKGLPPGPICNPGEPSVHAVLQPATTDYLYFVARGDGTHLFARTLDEHNANIEKVSHQ